MPNCIIKGLQDKLWVAYSNYSGELEINSIYLDSDVNRTDIYDYLALSVLEKAYSSMREDWAELQTELKHEAYKSARFYDEQQGWV